jgi:hypothetical protein
MALTPTCFSRCTPCIPGPCVPPPRPLNWGAAAFAAARSAVVSIANDVSGALFSGFWVTPTAVATAYSNVAGGAGSFRVIVNLNSGAPAFRDGPPMYLDAALVYAEPGVDVAVLTVNPPLFAGTVPVYKRTVLPLLGGVAAELRTGEDVYTVFASPDAGGAPTAFAAGTLVSPSSNAVLTDMAVQAQTALLVALHTGSAAAGGAVIGAPVIRAVDGVVAGIVLSASGGSADGDGQLFRALSAPLLGAAIGHAGGLLSRGVVTGPSAVPALHDTPALGMYVPVDSIDLASVVVPLQTTMVNVRSTPSTALGAPAVGAVALEPFLANTAFASMDDTVVLGNPANGLSATAAPDAALAAGFVRVADNGKFIDISAEDVFVVGETTGVGAVPVDSSEAVYSPVRVSGVPTSASTMSTDNVADVLYVSALGVVGFSTPAFPLFSGSLNPLNADALVPVLATGELPPGVLLAAPFATADFAADGDYTSGPGTPGGPLAVRVLVPVLAAGPLIVQWNGFSRTTGAPVAFQVQIACASASAASLLNSTVTFAYAQMPTTWAAAPWIAGTTMTSDPTPGAQSITPLLERTVVPAVGDVLYFGSHAYACSVGVARAPPATSAEPAHAYAAYPSLADVDANVPQDAPTLGATLAFAAPSALLYSYAGAVYSWPILPLTVSTVAGVGVGTAGLNTPSLPLVVNTVTGGTATDTAPRPLVVSTLSSALVTPTPLTAADISLMVSGALATRFGCTASQTGVENPTQTSVSLTPLLPTGLGGTAPFPLNQALILRTVTDSAGQPDLVTVDVTIAVPADIALFPVGAVFGVQLAHMNGASLQMEWDAAVSPATALSITRTGPSTFEASLGSGIPPMGIQQEAFTPTAVGATLVATRSLSIGDQVTRQRSNALVVGLPQAQSPAFIGPGTLTLLGGTKALMVQTSAPDEAHFYAATSQPALARRPLPYTPAPG